MIHSITDFESSPDAAGSDAYTSTGDEPDAHNAASDDLDTYPAASDDLDTHTAASDEPDAHTAASEDPRRPGDGDRRETDQGGERPAETGEASEARRVALGYALLFSLPVGVGVAVMLLRVTGGRPTDAIVVGPSLALATAVFLLVVGVSAGGSTNP
ncbi:hypothetical protein [Halobellus litoreus]|uniref:Uncharacterized protein n=1 Tax=Halobellus litoreus TaxID=755310 RepID=A0ABD6DT91_9EURY|nr:hypothetical protein [Halobellus litoreus]